LKKASTVPKPAEDVQTKDIAFLSRVTRLLRWGVDLSEEDAYKVVSDLQVCPEPDVLQFQKQGRDDKEAEAEAGGRAFSRI